MPAAEEKEPAKKPAALNFEMKSIHGKEVDLAKYHGKVVLIVNVASECGLTPQYEGLQKLHEKYAKEGLAILAFPCNQFGKQEPGTEAEILEFCRDNYDVEFDLFAKVDVNGDSKCKLYQHLTSGDAGKEFAGPIKWNFEKFLIDRTGKVIKRFEPRVEPQSKEVLAAVEAELKEKPARS